MKRKFVCYIRTDEYPDIEPVFCVIESNQSAVQVKSWLKKKLSLYDSKYSFNVGMVSELSDESAKKLGLFSPASAISVLQLKIKKYKRRKFFSKFSFKKNNESR